MIDGLIDWHPVARAPQFFQGVAQGINRVVVLVVQVREYFLGVWIDPVCVERQLVDDVFAARVNHDVERLQKLNAILDRPRALDRADDLETVAAHVGNRFRPRTVRPDCVPVGPWDAATLDPLRCASRSTSLTPCV